MILKRLATCEKCGCVSDAMIVAKNYQNRTKGEDWSDEAIEEYLSSEGFLPFECPVCDNFNNYRE